MANEEDTLLAATHTDPLPPPSAELESIFREHHPKVFGTAYRITGNAQDAEDVLQTVFLRLLRRQDEIDLSPGPASYLHRAAVNAALDLMRARSRSQSIALDELEVPLQGGNHLSPDRGQEDREIRRSLREAMLTLTPRSAEIFSMRFLEEMTNREIAKALGISQAAVGVAVHRARSQVKKQIRSFAGGN